jgi:hypothetical protein
MVFALLHPGDLSLSDWLYLLIGWGLIAAVALAGLVAVLMLLNRWATRRKNPPLPVGRHIGDKKNG